MDRFEHAGKFFRLEGVQHLGERVGQQKLFDPWIFVRHADLVDDGVRESGRCERVLDNSLQCFVRLTDHSGLGLPILASKQGDKRFDLCRFKLVENGQQFN